MTKKVGRNDPCPCGSGKKYKSCCMLKEKEQAAAKYTPSGKRKFKARVITATDKSLSVFSRSSSVQEIPKESDALERLKIRMTNKDFRKKEEEVAKEGGPKEEALPFAIPKSSDYTEKPEERERHLPKADEEFKPTKEDFRKK